MNLTTIPNRPFSQGFIRVATRATESGKTEFLETIEILARHHEARVPDVIAVPKLAQHPLADQLKESVPANKAAQKLVEVPIRMFFDKAKNAIDVAYQAYDEDGRPICRGNGSMATRMNCGEHGVVATVETPCAGPDVCAFASVEGNRCRRQVCMSVQIEGQENPLSVFEVRTSSYGAYKALNGQLQLIEQRFGGLRHVPLKLQLWKTSNQASEYESFDVFKLHLDASSEIEAMKKAKQAREAEVEAGLGTDFDSIYSAIGGASMGFGDEDFSVVQDFYRPVSQGHRVSRRAGTVAMAQTLVGPEGKGAVSSAGEYIAAAVVRATQDGTEMKAQSAA